MGVLLWGQNSLQCEILFIIKNNSRSGDGTMLIHAWKKTQYNLKLQMLRLSEITGNIKLATIICKEKIYANDSEDLMVPW